MHEFPILQISVYSLALWFGLYLLARDWGKAGLRYAGLGLVFYALGIGADTLARYTPNTAAWSPWRIVVILLPALCWIGAIWPLIPRIARSGLPRRPVAAVLVASIFFLMGLGMLVVPQEIMSSDVVLLAIAFDLGLLGYAIAALDAYDEGETFLRDALRSFDGATLLVLIFGGQVVLVMAIEGAVRLPMLVLLFGTVTAAIALQVFADRVQTFLDGVSFSSMSGLRRKRADLRAASGALPRIDDALDITAIDEAEFVRLTRRALGHMGDLGRLASSPLTRLPVIERRLGDRGLSDNTLERAAELKALLAESIARLKPRGEADFGASDEWRYYNALYFPYVAGLKPYSRRDQQDDLDPAAKQALDWFRAQVPERTLHNWQNAAAKLIAQDIREAIEPRSYHEPSDALG